MFALISAAGCSDADKSSLNTPQETPSPSASASILSPDMPGYLKLVDDANASVSNTIIKAAGRPTVTQQGANLTSMVIRDEDESTWEAGDYNLIVNCVGTGKLFAFFQIGEESEIKELQDCSPTSAATDTVHVMVKSKIKASSRVMIIPVGSPQAAVSYQVQRQ
jgi:hypothetical protein